MFTINLISDYLLKEKYNSIIPLIIKKRKDGVIVECYEDIRCIIEHYFKDKGEIVFNDEFVNDISKVLKPFFDKYGYEALSYSENDAKIEYICTPNSRINRDLIRDDTIVLTNEDDSLLEYGIDSVIDDSDDYQYLACGNVINGKIISACTENSHVLPHDETEVGIETVNEYQGLGYASSALALEVVKLISSGRRKIYYECEESNLPSIRCAEKVGFDLLGTNYYLIANKK